MFFSFAVTLCRQPTKWYKKLETSQEYKTMWKHTENTADIAPFDLGVA